MLKEEPVMHSASNNIKFKPDKDVNEVIDELFELLRSGHQGNLEVILFLIQFN